MLVMIEPLLHVIRCTKSHIAPKNTHMRRGNEPKTDEEWLRVERFYTKGSYSYGLKLGMGGPVSKMLTLNLE